MDGASHALTGLASGAAAGLLLLHLPVPQTIALAGLTAGAAVLPDIDHPQATLAQSFGFVTKTFARLVSAVCGGHRRGSHCLIACAVFATLASLAVAYRHDGWDRVALAAFLTLIISGGLIGLRGGVVLRKLGLGRHGADIAGLVLGAGMAVTGTALSLVAVATGLGCLTHLAGDGLTEEGVPFLLPFTGRNYHLLPGLLTFRAGSKPEAVVDLCSLACLGWLAYQALVLHAVIA